jgi:hypothetical protein
VLNGKSQHDITSAEDNTQFGEFKLSPGGCVPYTQSRVPVQEPDWAVSGLHNAHRNRTMVASTARILPGMHSPLMKPFRFRNQPPLET